MAWDAGAALNIGSGVLMAVLGLALILANPRQDWNRIFGLFAGFWGIQIVSLNAVRVVETADAALVWGKLGLAFLLPLYFFLALFAAVFPRPRPPLGTSGVAVTLLLLPAAAALAALFLWPGQLVRGIEPLGQGFTMRWGPLLPILVTAPFYGAAYYALLTMFNRLGEARSEIERRQVTFVLAALALFLAYNVPLLLVLFGGTALGLETAPEAETTEARAIALIMIVGLALLAHVATRLARLSSRAAAAPQRRAARWVLVGLAAAFLAGAAVAALNVTLWPQLDILGLVRAGSVGLIVYAIARYQLFDIDLRVKYGAAAAAATVAAAALAAAAWIALQQVEISTAFTTALTAAAALAAFVPLLRLSRTAVDRIAPRISRTGDHLYLRKLEVYRAAVESVQQRGGEPPSDHPDLVSLRARLGLDPREHDLVARLMTAAPAGPPQLRPGETAFGKYRVEAAIAEGGHGRVVLARDTVLDRPVVIKELLATWRSGAGVAGTLLREARIAGALNHPNIVAVYEAQAVGSDHYLVMEFCPRGSLEDRIHAGPLPPAEACRVTRGVLEALAAAHARAVVHRDVKPANILFDGRDNPKLADFGVAQLAAEAQERTLSGLTMATFQPGTLQYMSPEQARGLPVDARSDLYAAAVVLHRMLTGAPHVDLTGLDPLSARNAIAAARPPPVSSMPTKLAGTVTRGLEPEPTRRFQSAEEFLKALAGL